jgi:hypothetical protein
MEYKQLTSCPFCGLKDDYSRLALKCDPGKQSITYSICQCGYIYADYYMADVETYYKEQYHNDVSVKYGVEGIAQEVINNEAKRADILMPVIEQFGNITSALDFGSSSGYLLYEIKRKYNCDVWGVEISKVFRDYANLHGIPSVENIDMIGGTFHLITCIHVLEHALDPSKILNGLYAHGDSNTTYIFQVPFFSYGFFHPVLYSYNMFATVLDTYGFVAIKQLLNPANLTFIARKK